MKDKQNKLLVKRSFREEKKLKESLKRYGWEPVHVLELGDWVSPYSGLKYSFEQAIRIENLDA